jgi:predicted O-methyltransferase YrrM
MSWFNYSVFYDFISEQEFDTFVELGVWKGESISYLASKVKFKNPSANIYAIDIFEDWDKNPRVAATVPNIRNIFNNTLRKSKVQDIITTIKSKSWEAAAAFEDGTVDFVFIDADHSYESVCKDIDSWLPKIKVGGIISGHDYNNPCGVKQAVDERFTDFDMLAGCWWVRL